MRIRKKKEKIKNNETTGQKEILYSLVRHFFVSILMVRGNAFCIQFLSKNVIAEPVCVAVKHLI